MFIIFIIFIIVIYISITLIISYIYYKFRNDNTHHIIPVFKREYFTEFINQDEEILALYLSHVLRMRIKDYSKSDIPELFLKKYNDIYLLFEKYKIKKDYN